MGTPISVKYLICLMSVDSTTMTKSLRSSSLMASQWSTLPRWLNPFPKKAPADFLRLSSTKSFVLALEEDYKKGGTPKEVLRIVKGGNDVELQGTWMDGHLALKFAGWLAPEFEVWVYKKIRELLTTGKTEVRGKNENFGYVLRDHEVAAQQNRTTLR